MTDWISISAAGHHPAGESETVARRRQLISLILDGLINARAFRTIYKKSEFSREDDLEIFCAVGNSSCLDDAFLPFAKEFSDESQKDWSEIIPYRIGILPFDTKGAWHNQVNSRHSITQRKADWELCHFKKRTLTYVNALSGFGGDTGFGLVEYDVFSVEVEREAVARLMGIIPDAKRESNAHPSRYDWEAAFADVAAAFYHDTEFENINARGVQAEIVQMMLDSFERRGLAVPAADSCKPKAAKLLGALRARKPK
jgi:hypothetical protein